jgi:DNA-binding NarL/FixJ family response regulator
MYDDQEMITKMMEMGANAYLTKTTDPGRDLPGYPDMYE